MAAATGFHLRRSRFSRAGTIRRYPRFLIREVVNPMLRTVVVQSEGREIGRFPIDIGSGYPLKGPATEQDFVRLAKWFLVNSGVKRTTMSVATYTILD